MKAFFVGLRSNMKALKSKEYSSLIYELKHTKKSFLSTANHLFFDNKRVGMKKQTTSLEAFFKGHKVIRNNYNIVLLYKK